MSGWFRDPSGFHRLPRGFQRALLPYLVLLPMGFAEPSRSPGLLVSSYLAVSPLPRPGRKTPEPRRFLFCCTFPIRAARRTGRWALPTIAPCGVRTFLRGTSLEPEPPGRLPDPKVVAQAPQRPSHPATNLSSIIRPGLASDNRPCCARSDDGASHRPLSSPCGGGQALSRSGFLNTCQAGDPPCHHTSAADGFFLAPSPWGERWDEGPAPP